MVFLQLYAGHYPAVIRGNQLNLIIVLVTVIGFFVYGCIAGLFATAARIYPAHIRTTGVGWAIGVGRIGSTVSPAFAGLLFASGWGSSGVYWLYAVPQVLGLLLMLLIVLPKVKQISTK